MIEKMDSTKKEHVLGFKSLIKKAMKQKKHLKWVYPTIKSYDLRKARKIISYYDMYFIRNDNEIIGMLDVYPKNTCGNCGMPPKDPNLIDIAYFILSEYSGKGLGKKAVQEAIMLLKSKGKKISACTAKINEVSINMLKGLGFKKVRNCSKNRGYSCYFIDGKPVDGIKWRLG